MRMVTKYVAEDGTEFEDKVSCQKHDIKNDAEKELEKVLHPLPNVAAIVRLLLVDVEDCKAMRDAMSKYLKRLATTGVAKAKHSNSANMTDAGRAEESEAA